MFVAGGLYSGLPARGLRSAIGSLFFCETCLAMNDPTND
jgi:hypothetical protein